MMGRTAAQRLHAARARDEHALLPCLGASVPEQECAQSASHLTMRVRYGRQESHGSASSARAGMRTLRPSSVHGIQLSQRRAHMPFSPRHIQLRHGMLLKVH
jgi:hypothetical protein